MTEKTMYSTEELALRLRMRQSNIQREIEAESPKGITTHMAYLIHSKARTDAILSDIATEMGWKDGFHKTLDREIEERASAAHVWGS